jgi:hypothetical protein
MEDQALEEEILRLKKEVACEEERTAKCQQEITRLRGIVRNHMDSFEDIEYRRERRGSLSKFAIALCCLTLLIGFCVYAGTHWRDAYKAAYDTVSGELKEEFERGDIEKFGFHKIIIGEQGYNEYEIYYRRKQ